MPTIGLITEGPTDLQVLTLFLNGLYGGDFVPTALNPVSNADGTYPPTGWGKVLAYIGSGEFRDALSNRNFPVDLVVVHLDSDSCEDFKPRIPHTDGKDTEVMEQIKQRLIQEIDREAPTFYAANADRIIFAIAVRSTECWLLPLFFSNNTRTKTKNCLGSLNEKLSPKGFSIDKHKKQQGYKELLRQGELKPRKIDHDTVVAISNHNPGFADFVAQIEVRINTDPPGTPNHENPETDR